MLGSTYCLETLYSMLEYLIEVYQKVLEPDVNPIGKYSVIRFISDIFCYSCLYITTPSIIATNQYQITSYIKYKFYAILLHA